MSRILLILAVLLATAGAVVAYGDPTQIARAKSTVSDLLRPRVATRAVQISRGQAGEFALQAKINGVNAPMVIDTALTFRPAGPDDGQTLVNMVNAMAQADQCPGLEPLAQHRLLRDLFEKKRFEVITPRWLALMCALQRYMPNCFRALAQRRFEPHIVAPKKYLHDRS